VSVHHLGPLTNFSSSLKFSLDCCGFVIKGTLSYEKTGMHFTVGACPRQTAAVVYWSQFLAANLEVLSSIPGATKFSE
jgi:hypothetical protein